MVTVDAWGRPIDRRSIRQIDQQRLASLKSTLDPLTLTPLRNAVIHSAWGRGKISLPPGIAKKLYDTRVFVGSDVRESKFRKDLAKSMRVERISGEARNQKLKIKDERHESQQADKGRQQEIDRLNAEAKKGNKEADQQARQLEQQQRKETRDLDKTQRKAQQQPQGERIGKPAKPETKPPSQGAPKQENKKKPQAKPDAHGHGKGKGKP